MTSARYKVETWPGYQASMRPAGPWLRISGGDLPCPVEVRLHRHADGRFVITGLMLGDELHPREITSATLRRIRLAAIIETLLADYDPDNPAAWTAATSVLLPADLNAKLGGQVARGRARGPDEDTLRDFARAYQIELARQPRRATTAAAAAFKISRATAHRWAGMCRDRGWLP